MTGGRRRGITEYGLFGLDVILETGKLLGWPGGQFRAGFAYSSGTSLSTRYVGNNFPIQLADFATPGPRLTYLSYTQSMLDDKLSIRFGRLTINSVYGEEFLASEYFKAFNSVGFDLVPQGVFLNAPGAFGYPITTWGTRIKFEPAEQFYAMAGSYNGDPALKASNRDSVDFSLRGPPFVIGEFGFRRNYGEAATGLPGNLKLGAYFNGGKFAAFDSGLAGGATAIPGVPPKIVRGNYGFYILGDQAILRWGDPGENRHLGVFAALTVAPNERVDPVPYFFDAGVVAYGFLPSRPLRLLQRRPAARGRGSRRHEPVGCREGLRDDPGVDVRIRRATGIALTAGPSVHHQSWRQQGHPKRPGYRGGCRCQLLTVPRPCDPLNGPTKYKVFFRGGRYFGP